MSGTERGTLTDELSFQKRCIQMETKEAVGPSVDGEHIALDLMAQLSLQVTQLFFEDGQCRHDDVLWP